MLTKDVEFQAEEKKSWSKIETLGAYLKGNRKSKDDLSKEAKNYKA